MLERSFLEQDLPILPVLQFFSCYVLFSTRWSMFSPCLASCALPPCTSGVAVVNRCRWCAFSKDCCFEPTSNLCSSLPVAALRIGHIYVCSLGNTTCRVPLKFVGNSYVAFFHSVACNPGCNTLVGDSRCTELCSKLEISSTCYSTLIVSSSSEVVVCRTSCRDASCVCCRLDTTNCRVLQLFLDIPNDAKLL